MTTDNTTRHAGHDCQRLLAYVYEFTITTSQLHTSLNGHNYTHHLMANVCVNLSSLVAPWSRGVIGTKFLHGWLPFLMATVRINQ